MDQNVKTLPGSGQGPGSRDSLGRTVCMYTANADAYRTAGRHISTGDEKTKIRARTYASTIEHQVSRFALAKTPKYRETSTNSHEGEKIEESDRCFGDHRVVCCGHP